MARIFVYDGRQFPDPDSKLSVEDVRKQLAEFFPELANAETREEKRGEDTVYTFTKRIGTKGKSGQPDVVAIQKTDKFASGLPEAAIACARRSLVFLPNEANGGG